MPRCYLSNEKTIEKEKIRIKKLCNRKKIFTFAIIDRLGRAELKQTFNKAHYENQE